MMHDLRAPLARALTWAKLLREAAPAEKEECEIALLAALEEVDAQLRQWAAHDDPNLPG